jgi:hypothetical protein
LRCKSQITTLILVAAGNVSRRVADQTGPIHEGACGAEFSRSLIFNFFEMGMLQLCYITFTSVAKFLLFTVRYFTWTR